MLNNLTGIPCEVSLPLAVRFMGKASVSPVPVKETCLWEMEGRMDG